MERIVKYTDDGGRRFTFRVAYEDGIPFWNVESNGQLWRAPLRALGNEVPHLFFPAVAKAGVDHYGL